MKSLFLTLFSFWVINIQAAELFLQTEKSGFYSVSISDQTILASSNYFRFFDLAAGTHKLTVSDIFTGQNLFTVNVTLTGNNRKVIKLSPNWQLINVAEFAVTHPNWYTENTSQQGSTTNNQTTVNFGSSNSQSSSSSTNSDDFSSILARIKQESFDKNKLTTAQSITKKNTLTADQIAEICKLFSFDSYRLEYAKFAYDYCSNKNSYHKVSATFSFSSYAKDLEKYIDSK